jgi:Tol biopolymer transport system component
VPANLTAQDTDRGIVFVSMRDGIEDIYVMAADGSDVRRVTVTEPFDGEQRGSWVPAWSPDGSRIAFASNRDDGGSANLYVVDADGSHLERLTDHEAFDYTPDWSPEGSRIAFMSNRDGSPEVYVMNADGTGVRRLTYLERGSGGLCCPDWSPDGARVVFQAKPGAWSPDGEWVAFLGVSAQAWVMRPDRSEARAVTAVDGRAMYPVWSPAGERLAFSFLPAGLEGEELFQAAEVYTVKLDGTDLTRLTDNEVTDGHANWW